MVDDAYSAPPVPGRQPRLGDAANHREREEYLMLLLFIPNGSRGRTVRYRREGTEITFRPPDPPFPPESPWNPWGHVQ